MCHDSGALSPQHRNVCAASASCRTALTTSASCNSALKATDTQTPEALQSGIPRAPEPLQSTGNFAERHPQNAGTSAERRPPVQRLCGPWGPTTGGSIDKQFASTSIAMRSVDAAAPICTWTPPVILKAQCAPCCSCFHSHRAGPTSPPVVRTCTSESLASKAASHFISATTHFW